MPPQLTGSDQTSRTENSPHSTRSPARGTRSPARGTHGSDGSNGTHGTHDDARRRPASAGDVGGIT
ncbi:hypothetical protein [Actinomyces viscosus]|uniref:hypothetical protein n=1 Tax=Actinomyces viscosus TaxID=1656 RepID=UPI0013DECA79|nr:hypothetical protein [Actinomyces viscosus]